MNSLDAALGLWRRGISVIPVPLPDDTHDGKRPSIAWADFQRRRPTEAEIRAWWATPQNLGIVCGAVSGIVAIDADGPEASAWLTRRLPWTPWQTRTRRGYHLFFRHPGGHVRNRAGLRGVRYRTGFETRERPQLRPRW
jgi:hypothetical protein